MISDISPGKLSGPIDMTSYGSEHPFFWYDKLFAVV